MNTLLVVLKTALSILLLTFALNSCVSLFLPKSAKERLAENKKITNDEVIFLNLKPYDTLTDIGAQSGFIDAHYSIIIDNLYFNLLDTDEKALNKKNVNNNFKSIHKIYKNHNYYNYNITINTTEKLPLSNNSCSKVLCRKTIHEFTNQDEMIAEIRRILKPDGELFIIETVPTKPNQIDSTCKFKLLSADSIVTLFSNHRFELKKKKVSEKNAFNFLCFKKQG